jgi:hypothetical protein
MKPAELVEDRYLRDYYAVNVRLLTITLQDLSLFTSNRLPRVTFAV